MPTLLNNCANRQHATHYPADGQYVPFYDLDCTGRQGQMAKNLAPGAQCVVVSREAESKLRFDWFTFAHERICRAPEGENVRVFYGTHARTEELSKTAAARSVDYAAFFDKNGNFKRASVVKDTR